MMRSEPPKAETDPGKCLDAMGQMVVALGITAALLILLLAVS